MLVAPLSASMRFSEASAAFLQSRTSPVAHASVRYISKNTFKDYRTKLKSLGSFFGDLKLEEIHLGHIAEYQRMRSTGEGFTRPVGKKNARSYVPSAAGANKINAELSLLIRLLRRTHCWTDEDKDAYLRFQPVDSDIPRALSPDEQERFLVTAGSRPEWQPLWWYSIAALHLTFSTDEMRTIRIADINLGYQLISVNRRYGKNKYRRREIPIVDGACMWALERLIERAKSLGATQPHHFLFPFRVVRNTFDPERHISETGMRKQFEELRAAAGVPWFQFNGWRHTAITRLAEAGVPIATIMARAGHVTRKMSEHYTHISDQAHRVAIAGVSQRKPVVSIAAAQLRRQVSGW